jgi:hypothetical protein
VELPANEEAPEEMGAVSPISVPAPVTGTGYLSPAGNWSVKAAGFDTVVFRFRPEDTGARWAISHPLPAGETFTAGSFGTFNRDGEPMAVSIGRSGTWIADHGFARVLAFPASGVVNVEGRLAALVAADGSVLSLAPFSSLASGVNAAAEIVRTTLGVADLASAAPQVRRADPAVDLVEADANGQAGRAALAALACVSHPRWFATAHPCGDGWLEGVDWRTKTNSIQFRIYDKGRELGNPKHRVAVIEGGKRIRRTHPDARPPGTHLRFERQFRPTSTSSLLTVDEFAASDLRHVFLGPWTKWTGPHGALVCGHDAAATEIASLFSRNEITERVAVQLLGLIGALDAEVAEALWLDAYSKKALRARRRLREYGIAFDRSLPRNVGVRIGELLTIAAAQIPSGSSS